MSVQDKLTNRILQALRSKGYREVEAEFGEDAVKRAVANSPEVLGPKSLDATKSPSDIPGDEPEVLGLKSRDIDEDFGTFPPDLPQGQVAPPTRGKYNKPLAAAIGASAFLAPQEASGQSPVGSNRIASMRGIGPVSSAEMYGAAIAPRETTSEPTAEAGEMADEGIRIADADPSGLRKAIADKDNAIANLRRQGVDTTKFEQEQDAVKEAYKSARTKNEWLEVAQLVGQSLARFGAYAEGKKDGRLIGAGLDIPSIDYSKRIDQAQEDYRTSLQDIAGRRSEAIGAERENYRTDLQKLGMMDERVKGERAIYEEMAARNRAQAQLDASKRAEARREAEATTREDRREIQENKRYGHQEAQDLTKELNALKKLESSMTDPAKGEKKMSLETARDRADVAGMSAEEIKQIEDTAPIGGWGLVRDDADRSKALITKIREQIADSKARVEKELAAAKEVRKTGKLSTDTDTTPTTASTNAPKKKVTTDRLQAYMKQYGLSEQEARKALTSQGLDVE